MEEEAAARAKAEEEQRQRELAQSRISNDPQKMQEQQVRLALNQQTHAQFQAYAQTQFPGDEKQVSWIYCNY